MPTNGEIYAAKIACWYNGQLGLSVRHYRVENVVGAADLDQAFADQLATEFAPLYAAVIGDEAVFLGCSVRNLSVLPAPAAVASTTGETPGTVASPQMPSQVSGIITLRTAFAGRSRRGRAYIPFPTQVHNDAATDRPTNAYMLLIAFIAVELRQTQSVALGGSSADFVPIVLSQDADVPPSPIYAFILGTTPQPAWATQRRRGTYGASNPRTIPL